MESSRQASIPQSKSWSGFEPDADKLTVKDLNFDPYAEMTEKFTKDQLISFIAAQAQQRKTDLNEDVSFNKP